MWKPLSVNTTECDVQYIIQYSCTMIVETTFGGDHATYSVL